MTQPLSSQVILSLLRRNEVQAAVGHAVRALDGLLDVPVVTVRFTNDSYSLNSVSGRAVLADGTERFFKFHVEEGEESGLGEYYRAELLQAAGLPVDVPIAVSNRPGEQLVVYRVREDPRMVDVCFDLEVSDGDRARLPSGLDAALVDLYATVGRVTVASLRESGDGAQAPVHQLFHHRLVDAGTGRFPGGRYAGWYLGSDEWQAWAGRRWRVNGTRYRTTLREAVDRMAVLLDPAALAAQPVTVAHGDDHFGNVWVAGDPARPELLLFDPAFADDRIPALLAPVKATYHNVFAHPFWLYHPELAVAAGRTTLAVDDGSGEVRVEAPAMVLSPLRRRVLDVLTEQVWIPLLGALHERGRLPADWTSILRAALAACPLLVTDLVADRRSPAVRAHGLASVLVAASPPEDGTDDVQRWLDVLRSSLPAAASTGTEATVAGAARGDGSSG